MNRSSQSGIRILNESKGTLLADRAVRAAGFFSRLAGLLPRSGLGKGEGLILDPSNSIHSFFMRFTFDAIFIDREGVVVGLIPSFRPFRISPLFFSAAKTIELPEGAIRAGSVCLGDRIKISV